MKSKRTVKSKRNSVLMIILLIAIALIAIAFIKNFLIQRGTCPEGYIFSEKTCDCVLDSFGCKGLNGEDCENNPNCFSFNRGGSCSCPNCKNYLVHQCLPNGS